MSFTRVVCGLDRSPESLEAARQAARLAPAGAAFVLVTAVEVPLALAPPETIATEWDVLPAFAEPDVLEALEEAARERLERARAELAPLRPAEARVVQGDPVAALLAEIGDERAALLAVGVREEHRLLGLLGGSVASAAVRGAPCSVLLARPAPEPERFPRSIVAGTDGSEPSLAAVAVASELAGRLGARLSVLVAEPERHAGAVEAVRRRFPTLEVVETPRDPVDALCDDGADLVVVGQRGLGRLRALGSVSERVAHRAPCSVLVVR